MPTYYPDFLSFYLISFFWFLVPTFLVRISIAFLSTGLFLGPLLFFFIVLRLLRTIFQVFGRMSLDWDWSDVFSPDWTGVRFWGGRSQMTQKCHFRHLMSWIHGINMSYHWERSAWAHGGPSTISCLVPPFHTAIFRSHYAQLTICTS